MKIIIMIRNMAKVTARKDIKAFYVKNVQIIMKKDLRTTVFHAVMY